MQAHGRPVSSGPWLARMAALSIVAALTTGFAATSLAAAEGLRLAPPKLSDTDQARTPAEPTPDSGDDPAFARMCDAFGEGFTYLPASGTCLKIGGYVKFGTSFGTSSGSASRPGSGPFDRP
jgi:hypothetical protein